MKVKTCIGNLQYMCFLMITYWPSWLKTRKLRYLCHMASKWKNNGTFFSSTLKVQEKNVPLFFSFEASWLRYDHFLISIIVFHLYFRAILTIFWSRNRFTKHIFMNSNKIYVVCLQIVKFNLYCVLIYNNMRLLPVLLSLYRSISTIDTRVSQN